MIHWHYRTETGQIQHWSFDSWEQLLEEVKKLPEVWDDQEGEQ